MNVIDKYIGISEDRLHHILGVARKCYQIAKDMGKDENFCRKMFMIGWCHDVGYEFSKSQSDHPDVGAEMYRNMTNGNFGPIDEFDFAKMPISARQSYDAIKKHGKYTEDKTDEWKILNIADMTIDSKGNDVDVMDRLDDIKSRYGEHSDQYLTACDICIQIGLVDRNSMERDAIGG